MCKMGYEVYIIREGYAHMVGEKTMAANCTCTLIKGKYNIIVDTLTPWDRDIITDGLKEHALSCSDIHYVVCTHGHSDHIGNNNLFLNAKQHFVGYSINHKDQYTLHSFESGEMFTIDEGVTVMPTPGHTGEDVSVVVKTKTRGTVVVAGDLFEREEDINDPTLWRELAGSQFPEKQEENRNKIIALADYIVPGHGPMFKVTDDVKSRFKTR